MSYARQIKLASMTVGTLAATVALAASAPIGWYNFGWRTPRYVDEKVNAPVNDFRREYRCDKIEAKQRRVIGLDNTAPEKVPELQRLQKVYDDARCAEFEF